MNRSTHRARTVMAYALGAASCFAAYAQAPAPAAAPEAATPAPTAGASPALEQLAWLRGCWAGNVNRRDFVEQWLPPRADMMVGVSHTTVQNRKDPNMVRTEDYTYLRMEARSDGVYYVVVPSGTKELALKLTSVDKDKGALVFTFAGSGDGFPQRIVYHRTEAGMLFATVAGKVDGKDKEVIYPMHRVDCTTLEPARGEHG